MNVYVWQRLGRVSNSYHASGGLTVVAKDLDQAMALANAQPGCVLKADDTPDLVLPVAVRKIASANLAPRVFVFPDAGCC